LLLLGDVLLDDLLSERLPFFVRPCLFALLLFLLESGNVLVEFLACSKSRLCLGYFSQLNLRLLFHLQVRECPSFFGY